MISAGGTNLNSRIEFKIQVVGVGFVFFCFFLSQGLFVYPSLSVDQAVPRPRDIPASALFFNLFFCAEVFRMPRLSLKS